MSIRYKIKDKQYNVNKIVLHNKNGRYTNIRQMYYGSPSKDINNTLVFDERSINYLRIQNTREYGNQFLRISFIGTGKMPKIEYSYDGNEWFEAPYYDSHEGTGSIPFPYNSTIYLKGNNEYISNENGHVMIDIPVNAKIIGDIISLFDETCNEINVPINGCFNYLFGSNDAFDVSNLELNSFSLTEKCYQEMFFNNYEIIGEPPFMPSKILPKSCYQHMYHTNVTGSVIKKLSFNFRHVEEIHTQSLENISNECIMYFSTKLKILDDHVFSFSSIYSSIYDIYYEFEETDQVLFDPNNVVSKGAANKANQTYNIYTNNSLIKNGALANADQYTIVNVYHLDGSPWE